MTTMKAVRIHTYGGPEVLTYEDAPLPEVREDDVLIRVLAAAVNPIDWNVRRGYVASYFNHVLPLILGWDVAGVIAAVGSNVADFQVGDDVYAWTDIMRDGAYAEYIAVRGSEVAYKPQSLDYLHAAAVPQVTLTAWQSLLEASALSAGQTILIHGAAGGVGHMAVQLAKWRGARVIGTASSRNQEFLRQLGVDEAIDYTDAPFEDAVRDVDVVLDTIGGEVLQRSWQVLRPGGILVSIMEPPSAELAAAHGVQTRFVTTQANAQQLAEIAGLIDAAQVGPIVSTILPLSEVQQAHRMSETRHTRGKIVLQVAE